MDPGNEAEDPEGRLDEESSHQPVSLLCLLSNTRCYVLS